MVQRQLLVRLDSWWSAACIWFIRRSPLPPDRSLRLLGRLSAMLMLPCPCPVRTR